MVRIFPPLGVVDRSDRSSVRGFIQVYLYKLNYVNTATGALLRALNKLTVCEDDFLYMV